MVTVKVRGTESGREGKGEIRNLHYKFPTSKLKNFLSVVFLFFLNCATIIHDTRELLYYNL